jgi:hypothetical protein
MSGRLETSANTGQWSREIVFLVMNHLIGVRRVFVQVPVARDDEIIAQVACLAMQVRDQRLSVPFQQTLVLTPHALATSTRQEQNGAGWQC